jgi:magnesium transporter
MADTEVRSLVWRHGNLVEVNCDFERISDHLADDDSLIWVDVYEPSDALLAKLAGELSLDPLAVEDAVGHAERAKATRYANYTFITVYGTRIGDDNGRTEPPPVSGDQGDTRQSLQISRVSAFVFKGGVITIRRSPGFDMDEVVQRWDDNSDLIKFGVGALVHGLLDVIVDGHFAAVQVLDDAIESLEDGLFDDNAVNGQVQRRTYQIRKALVQLRRVVLPMREVINGVLRHRKDFHASPELDPWYDDLYDHVLRVSEWTESLRDMVTAIFETNLSLQDARLNNVMKKLTSWAAIIAVPTAITGFFGQNVPYPGFGHESGFIASTLVIVGVAAALYWFFRRRSWL